MTYKSKRILTLTIVNLLLVGYVLFMFYKSQPEFINNYYGRPSAGDYVNVYDSQHDGSFYSGMVVQTDSSSFTLNVSTSMADINHDSGIYSIPYKGFAAYKIIGKGTFYHRVNAYVGFNIMFITIVIIIILALVTLRAETLIVYQILSGEEM